MWETWLFWILVGGLVLFMFRRGGCCGHAGHGGSGNKENAGDSSRNSAHGGCH